MRILTAVVVCIALIAATAAAAARPVQQLVLQPGDLPGWTVPAHVSPQTPAAFAKDHDKTTKEILKTGFVSGATAFLKGPGNGLSIAARYRTPEQARHEALRLYRSNLNTDPGIKGTSIPVKGIPGAHAIQMTGKHEGKAVLGYEIVFAHNTDMMELFVIGLATDIDQAAVLKAARTLWQRSLAS
jgi:hypothetical protein